MAESGFVQKRPTSELGRLDSTIDQKEHEESLPRARSASERKDGSEHWSGSGAPAPATRTIEKKRESSATVATSQVTDPVAETKATTEEAKESKGSFDIKSMIQEHKRKLIIGTGIIGGVLVLKKVLG